MIIDPINPFSQELVDRFTYSITGHIRLLGVLLLGILLGIGLLLGIALDGISHALWGSNEKIN